MIGPLLGGSVLGCCSQLLLLVLAWPMDPFDDVFSEAPVSRARAGGKFIPKAKAKQLARKEISTSNQVTSNDGKNEHVAPSSTSLDTVGNAPRKSSNPVDLIPDTSAKEFLKSSHSSPVEIPVLDDNNPDLEDFQQVNVSGCNAVLVDAQHSTITASEVNSDWHSTNFPKAANEADPVGFDVSSVADIIPGTNLHNANSTIIENEEPSKYWEGEGPFLDVHKCLERIDASLALQAGPDVASQSASGCKAAMLENSHSNSSLERAGEVESAEFDLDPFGNTLPDPGLRNARKFQPKIKPRPRVGTAAVVASASVNDFCRTNSLSDRDNSCSSVPVSKDTRSLGAVIPSEPPIAMLSKGAAPDGPRDWPSSNGKTAGETTDIFSVLESFSDFLTQDASSAALDSIHEKGTKDFANRACHMSQVQQRPDYKTTHDSLILKEVAGLNEGDSHTGNGRLGEQEVGGSNLAQPLDGTLDDSSMNSGLDPNFEIPVHEEPMNTANSPTYDDFLHVQDVPGGKVVKHQMAVIKEKMPPCQFLQKVT